MVSDTVLAATIGVGGALGGSLITSLFNWLSTKQRLSEEKERRRAEFYYDKKVDALNDSYAQIQECTYAIGKFWPEGAKSKAEYQTEVETTVRDFRRAFDRARVYLDEGQARTLREAHTQFNTAASAIEYRTMNPSDKHSQASIDWDSVLDATEDAEEVLEMELTEPIQLFELE